MGKKQVMLFCKVRGMPKDGKEWVTIISVLRRPRGGHTMRYLWHTPHDTTHDTKAIIDCDDVGAVLMGLERFAEEVKALQGMERVIDISTQGAQC